MFPGVRHSTLRAFWHGLREWLEPERDHTRDYLWVTAALVPSGQPFGVTVVSVCPRRGTSHPVQFVGQGQHWHRLGRRHAPCPPAMCQKLNSLVAHAPQGTSPALNTRK